MVFLPNPTIPSDGSNEMFPRFNTWAKANPERAQELRTMEKVKRLKIIFDEYEEATNESKMRRDFFFEVLEMSAPILKVLCVLALSIIIIISVIYMAWYL